MSPKGAPQLWPLGPRHLAGHQLPWVEAHGPRESASYWPFLRASQEQAAIELAIWGKALHVPKMEPWEDLIVPRMSTSSVRYEEAFGVREKEQGYHKNNRREHDVLGN